MKYSYIESVISLTAQVQQARSYSATRQKKERILRDKKNGKESKADLKSFLKFNSRSTRLVSILLIFSEIISS